MAQGKRDRYGRRIPDEDEAPRAPIDTPPGFLRLEGAEGKGKLPPRTVVTESGLDAIEADGEAEEKLQATTAHPHVSPQAGNIPAVEPQSAGAESEGLAPAPPRRGGLPPALWLVGGALIGMLAMALVQRAVCGVGAGPTDSARGGSVASLVQRAVSSAVVPCPPSSEGSATSLNPSRRAELSEQVETARGRRTEPGTAEARDVARALILLGDDAVSSIRPVTGVESIADLGRTVSEPVDGYRRSAELYGRVSRYEPTLLQCSMLRTAAAAERLADTFEETARDPSLAATGATDFPATLQSMAHTYRRVALQQYEIVLQVPDHDPECTRRAEAAFSRLRDQAGQVIP